jgi:lipopolysaccharide transport system permease protein
MNQATFTEQNDNWDIVVKAKAGWFDLKLVELWNYRDLMWMFVRRDFVAQYKQTILGFLWHLIQPLLTTAMFLIVFGKFAKISTDNIQPAILFYMSGITIWNYFSSCLVNTSNTFTANAAIFGKVYFPRLVIPLSIIISNMIRFCIQFLLLLVFMIYYHFNGFPMYTGAGWFLLPVLICIMAGISFGLGIIISSFTTKYRDFTVLLSFAVQLAMYATPIIYPLSFLSNTKYRFIIELNPLTPVVEAFRYSVFGKGSFTPLSLAYSTGFMLIVIFIGVLIFNKVEKSFMDTV